ncbi:MAG: hypothetical protein KC502_13440 [Myxococcales bacterium]|nr:hypothetical protein [Myxococcales bacterium]
MNDLSKELSGKGVNVHLVVINAAGAAVDQATLTNQGDIPVLQDTDKADCWGEMGGGKDDFYLYGSDNKLVAHLPVSGTVTVNLSTDEGYANLRNAAAALK